MNDAQRRQLILKHTRPDAARLTHDGLYLGNQKWEHGMRMPGVNELITAGMGFGEEGLEA